MTRASDTFLVTGTQFQQIRSTDILVTPYGGSQTTLGLALAEVPNIAAIRLNTAKMLAYRPPVVWVIGDSIMARSSTAPGDTSPKYYSRGPMSWLRVFARGRLTHYSENMLAVGGTNIAEMVNDQLPLVLAQASPGDIVLANGGTNTYGKDHDPFDDTIIALWNSLADQCNAAGLPLVMMGIPPRNDISDPNQQQEFNADRHWRLQWAQVDHLKYVDAWAVSVTPYGTRPNIRVGWTSDGLHPVTLGAMQFAWMLYRSMEEYLPNEGQAPLMFSRYEEITGPDPVDPYGVIVPHGMFEAGGGTINTPAGGGTMTMTGAVGVGWTLDYATDTPAALDGSVVVSRVVDPDTIIAQVVQFTNITGGTREELFTLSQTVSSTGLWAPGDKIEVLADVSFSSPDGIIRTVDLQLDFDRGDGVLRTTNSTANLPDPNQQLVIDNPVSNGDAFVLTLIIPIVGSPFLYNYTAGPGDDATDVAAALAALIMADTTVTDAGWVVTNDANTMIFISPELSNTAATLTRNAVLDGVMPGATGQYGNIPTDRNISGILRTDRVTVVADVGGTSSVTVTANMWIDATKTGVGTIRWRQITTRIPAEIP